MKFWLFLTITTTLFFLTNCSPSESTNKESKKLKIVTTTNIIGDALINIVKDEAEVESLENIESLLAEVESLMGAGVDPHLYKAAPSDLSKLQEADIIVHNGLHLEGKMAEIFEKLARQKEVLVVADGIDKNSYRRTDENNTFDPHIWFNVKLWSQGIQYIGDQLGELDQKHKIAYKQNTKAYLAKLNKLDTEIRNSLKSIPENQRVLITTHDAFGYFGQAYNIELKPLQGISTLAEIGLQEATELQNFIVERKINAVFVETSTSNKGLQSIVDACKEKGHEVKIGGSLYADALGKQNTPEGNYIGMVRANINTIVNGLK